MPVSWIEYKGKKILYVDFRNQSEDEMINDLGTVSDILSKLSRRILLLGDVRDTVVSNRFFTWLEKYSQLTIKAKTLRSAVLGIDKTNKILLERFNFALETDLERFETEIGAKEYLVK
jgi:hypothetical protein